MIRIYRRMKLQISYVATALIFLIIGAGSGYFLSIYFLRSSQSKSLRTLPSEIKIGVLLPLSGDIGAIGSKMLNGAKLAAKIVNDSGGIGGRPVKLIIEDTMGLPDKAIEAVKKLVEVEGIKVIVGPATSPEVLAIAKYVNERHIVLISMSATASEISKLGDDYVFRVIPSDIMQVALIADLIKARGYKRVVTFVVANDYGIGLEEGLKNLIPNRIVGSIRYDPEKGDYRAELEQVKMFNPDAIFYALWVESGKVVFKQAMDLGLDTIPALGSEGICDISFFTDTKAAEYMAQVGIMGGKPTSPRGTYSYQQFYEAYVRVFNEEPSLYCDYTFDATMLAILAIAQASEYNGSKIKETLQLVSNYFIGATGYKALDKNGDIITATYDIWKVVKTKDSEYKFVIIGSWNPVTGLKLRE